MFACGIPIFFQEVAIGQYLGCGGLSMIGQLVPMLQGNLGLILAKGQLISKANSKLFIEPKNQRKYFLFFFK